MTREEAIEIINRENDPNNNEVWEVFPEYREALDMAIEALEQELCNDVISRQVVKEQMIKYGFHAPDMTVTEFVEDLLPVRPQEQTGHWINMEISINGDMSAECDKCGCIVRNSFTNNAINYCPNCGAKMFEPQESEDKE